MLPVKKMSKCRTRTRRAHHALKPVNYSVCPKCDHPKLPHAACDNCGYVNAKITLKLGKKEQES
jgi:large subunit ribosomal protein L32